MSSSCQLKFHLILKDLSILFHLGLIWAVMLLLVVVAITLPKPSGIRTLVMIDGHIAIDLLSRPSTHVNAPWHRNGFVEGGSSFVGIMDNAGTFHWSEHQINLHRH